MKPTFLHYPKCSTCQKAMKWLQMNGIAVELRNITEQNPTVQELTKWIEVSKKPIAKFFNTSGLRYKALNVKEIIKTAPDQQLIALLSSEGMLVKRPILITEHTVLVGFNVDEWIHALIR